MKMSGRATIVFRYQEPRRETSGKLSDKAVVATRLRTDDLDNLSEQLS